jgi:MtrB/PioB family decaheme-associated outer membrane protein
LVTKAPAAAAVLAPAWWFEGYAEIGGRFDMNNPDQRALGKFYRYEDLRPGVFGNFYYGAHRTGPDPLDIAAWGTNIGWDDQAFGLDVSKPGTYYFTFGWDQTPHVYSKDAKTTFSGVGGNVLTSPVYPTTTLAAAQAVVNANTNIFDLGIRRDTAAFQGRWTPNDNWDITGGYSHMHRDGTQQLSTENTTGSTRTSIQIAKPVDDVTQTGNVKAEYAGSTPWSKPFNIALGYGISMYNDQVGCGTIAGTNPPGADKNCVTYNNPWVATNAATNSFWNRYSLPPDNQAHTFTATTGVGLPLMSRYMGTFQYTWMKQDDSFLPSTINPALAPAVLSRGSLGGDARTLLSNNVITSQITSDLTATGRYRYYDYHSNTAPMTIAGVFNRPDSNSSAATTVAALGLNFNKQNASEEVVYRPWKWLDVGAAYEWERWTHNYQDFDDPITGAGINQPVSMTTNENAGKAFFDAKWGWSTLRTSVRFSERRLSGPYFDVSDSNVFFRTFDLQNRDSTIVKSQWDINVTDTVTITPTGGYRLDNYPADGRTTDGITKYESWNAGGDVSWVINSVATLYVSYIHENGSRDVFQSPVSNTDATSRTFLQTRDINDTIIVGTKVTAIPDKLFLNATYSYSRGTSQWNQTCGPTGLCTPVPVPTYPDTHNTNQRIDAQAKYMLDPTWMRTTGFLPTAVPYMKFRVVWEKNSNDSWQNMTQQLGWALPGADATLQKAVFLGMSNPNYDVVLGMVSFGVKW